jgi:hypothetical protein
MTASHDRFAPRSGFSVVLVAAAAALPAIASCSPPGRDLQPGRYRAALQTTGGELPFVLQAVRKSQQFKVVAVSGGRLTATIEGGYLRGEVRGDELRLAHFDGQTEGGYLRGELAGDTWTLAATHLRFVAVRNPDAELEDAPVTDAVVEPEAASP